MSCGELGKGAKTEHTPEPWIAEGSFIGIPNGKGTFYMSPLSGINQERRESDARRIVACVNACAGMTNEQIDNVCMISGSLLNRFGEQMAYLGQVEKQCDELLAALIPFGAIDLVEAKLPAEFAMLVLRARAAIASVKGGAA